MKHLKSYMKHLKNKLKIDNSKGHSSVQDHRNLAIKYFKPDLSNTNALMKFVKFKCNIIFTAYVNISDIDKRTITEKKTMKFAINP